MRNAFVNILEENIDERTMILVGDLGFGVMDNIQDKFPNQFLNVGVAEQNMTGLATGLALTGYKVFTYSIANFNTLRALEQIRNDIVYHDLNVIVVSVGGGVMLWRIRHFSSCNGRYSNFKKPPWFTNINTWRPQRN